MLGQVLVFTLLLLGEQTAGGAALRGLALTGRPPADTRPTLRPSDTQSITGTYHTYTE